MAVSPYMDSDPWQSGGAVQLTGPVGYSLRGPSFVGLQLPQREMPMVLAGVARLLTEERVIYCADACNRFDAYRFSHWARCMALDPQEVLSRIYLSRAFTIHQLSALATEKFPALPTKPEPPLLVVLGLESLFLDEQIPRFEREHFFRRTLRSLSQLRQRGFSLLVTVGEESKEEGVPSIRPWANQVARAADVMTRLRMLAGGAFTFQQLGGKRRRSPQFAERETNETIYTQIEIKV